MLAPMKDRIDYEAKTIKFKVLYISEEGKKVVLPPNEGIIRYTEMENNGQEYKIAGKWEVSYGDSSRCGGYIGKIKITRNGHNGYVVAIVDRAAELVVYTDILSPQGEETYRQYKNWVRFLSELQD